MVTIGNVLQLKRAYLRKREPKLRFAKSLPFLTIKRIGITVFCRLKGVGCSNADWAKLDSFQLKTCNLQQISSVICNARHYHLPPPFTKIRLLRKQRPDFCKHTGLKSLCFIFCGTQNASYAQGVFHTLRNAQSASSPVIAPHCPTGSLYCSRMTALCFIVESISFSPLWRLMTEVHCDFPSGIPGSW